MKKIIRLTESDLTRIVKKVIMEENENFDFSNTDKKLWSDYFTIKNGFQYIGNKSDAEIYSLKKDGFSLVVGIKHGLTPDTVGISIFLFLPQGKRINYLQEVKGVNGTKLKTDEFGKLSNLLQGALDFGKAQVGYDNMPPLPRF